MSIFDTVLQPIMVVVAWIMVQFHSLFTWLGLDSDSGGGWVLSIVGLVIVMRIVLIPLFVKQIKASRGLQLIQPQMQKLQAKYKGKTDPASRQAMQQEMMQLYRDAGTNPFASCLPILAQSPIFFALFRVLYSLPQVADGTRGPIGPMTPELAASAESSTLFGAPLSATFIRAAEFPDPTSVRVVTVVLIILMSVTTFTTQRQLTMKNMPSAALDNPMARQQRMLMYILPLVFAVSGINFPIGVLIYWFTTNLWSMGQQFYVIRNMPAPGSEAAAALAARKAKRAARKGTPLADDAGAAAGETPPTGGQRNQPVRKDRQRPPKQGTPQKPGTAGGGKKGSASGAPRSGGGKKGSAPGGSGRTSPAGGNPSARDQPGTRQPRPPGSGKGRSGRPPASGTQPGKQGQPGAGRRRPPQGSGNGAGSADAGGGKT